MDTGTEKPKKGKSVGRELAIASLVLGLFTVLMEELLLLCVSYGGWDSLWMDEFLIDTIISIILWSVVCINPLTGLSSLIIGIVALSKKNDEAAGPWGIVMAIAGIILGILGLPLVIIWWLYLMLGILL